QRRALGDPRFGAEGAAGQHSRKRLEVEAERDDADLGGGGDAERDQVALHRVGHRHQHVRGRAEPALHLTITLYRAMERRLGASSDVLVAVSDARYKVVVRGPK